jgi:hypothetical protein
MTELHDPAVREAIKARVRALQPNARGKWGSMTVDQMLWHVGSALEMCLGHLDARGEFGPPVPKSWLRFAILNLPWPKGAPTLQTMKATKTYDFKAEQARCLRLIDEFTAKPVRDRWPEHPALGNLTGSQYSRLQAKHLLHHLDQFGV